jgi:hypothetical protein
VLSDAALNEIKTGMASFFTNPSTATYNAVSEANTLYASVRADSGRMTYELVRESYMATLTSFNTELARKVRTDRSNSIRTLSQEQQRRLMQLR